MLQRTEYTTGVNLKTDNNKPRRGRKCISYKRAYFDEKAQNIHLERRLKTLEETVEKNLSKPLNPYKLNAEVLAQNIDGMCKQSFSEINKDFEELEHLVLDKLIAIKDKIENLNRYYKKTTESVCR